jgi:hypothetical protein
MCPGVGRIGKERILDYLKVLTEDLSGGTGKDHEEASVIDAGFETVKPDIPPNIQSFLLHNLTCLY